MSSKTERFFPLTIAGAALFGVAGLIFTGCGGDDGGGDKPGPAKPSVKKDKDKGGATDGGTAKKTPVGDQIPFPKDKAVGSVSGRVLFDGAKVPVRTKFSIASKAECVKLHEGVSDLEDETVIVDDNGGTLTVRNIFVYVKSGLEKYRFDVPSEPVVLDQKGCVYTPHVFGLMAGQTLQVKNSDPLAHNVHYFTARNKEVNISQGGPGTADVKSFDTEELFSVFKCDVHSWMRCHMGVVDHPAFAVSDKKGEFAFSTKLPSGKYTLEARHSGGGRKTLEIEVDAGGKVTPEKIEFKFERKELK
jgi:plastocyanin